MLSKLCKQFAKNRASLNFSKIHTTGIMSTDEIKRRFVLADKFKKSTYSVWVEFVSLVAEYKPLNLGQGFPDFAPPQFVTDALAEVANSDNKFLHQYTRGFGHPRLVQALSNLYSRLIDRPINPLTEVLVTCGAYEAIFSVLLSHIQQDDEVIIIEPFYDCYESIVHICGGKPRFISLKHVSDGGDTKTMSSNSWKLDEKELASLFNDRTKIIILNTPHNPTGKVFSYDELTVIADLCKKHNVVCLADEVYEWLVYEPSKHIRIATLPGMWERTLTVGSAGKTFNVTGWKCGWLYGPSYLVRNACIAHQNNVYTYNTPIQEAIALCFEKELPVVGTPVSFFHELSESLKPKRDAVVKSLTDAGFTPVVPDSGYFLIANWSNFKDKVDLSGETDKQLDFKFAKWMTKNVNVLGIPPSAFYSDEHKHLIEDYIRFCFFKKDETLDDFGNMLHKWKQSLDLCKL